MDQNQRFENNYFVDKIVVVTGGGQGIGRVICRTFAQKGSKVIIVERDEEAGKENQDYIQNELKKEALFIQSDVSQEESVKNLIEKIKQIYGKIDILINNAGLSTFGDLFAPNSVELFEKVINVNLKGTFLCSKYVAEVMKNTNIKEGAIINIASTRAFMSEPNTEAYSASKGGVVALTHSLAITLSKYHIRVNSISPGWIDVTPHQKSSSSSSTQLREIDHSQHPVGRVGTPDDVAQLCLFLASPISSSFITGQNFVVDGGMTIKMIYQE